MEHYLRKEFYELVRGDESFFDYIQETAPDGVWYWNIKNPEDNWINPRFWKVLGYNTDEISRVKDTWKKLIHPEDLKTLHTKCTGLSRKRESVFSQLIRCKHKNGSTAWFQSQGKAIRDDQGNITRILFSHNEVTNLEETKQALEENKKRFELMLNNSTDIIVELTAEGEQKYISPVVEKITGYTPRELQVPFTEVIHPDDAKRIKEHWKEVLDRPDIIHRDEYRHIHKTKGYVWMEASLKSYLDHPDIQSIICSVRDITERKKNEKLLRENEEHYKMLNNAATEMLALDNIDEIYEYITHAMSEQFPDAVCVFVTVNEKHSKARVAGIKGLDNTLLKKAIDITGYKIIGKKFNVLPSHSVKYKTGKITLFENKLEEFAGNEFPSAAARSIEKLLGIHKIYAIGINKDNTLYAILHFFTLRKSELTNHAYIESFIKQAGIIIERKIMEQQLKESEKRLSEANATKDKFFSIIAHDLRNPFNLLLGFSEMNLGYIKDKNYAKIEESERMIRESAEQGYVLLNNLLEWAQSQQGSLKFKPDYHNISERISKVLALLSNQAYQKEIAINNELKNDLAIYADANMFDTILRNLLFNAIKYSNKGGTVTIHTEKQKHGMKVSVSDTGVGMEQENIDKLFNLKKNYTSMGTKGEYGTGLGLILCKEFVDKHGGKMGVESEPGQGSTFWFTLPHKKD